MFSNGIDATYSLIKERKSISDLFIVHGSDIPVEDETGWERVYDGARETARAFKKKLHSITSNFRKVINEGYLTGIVGKHGFEWWHDFEHGQALLSLAACPAYALGLKYLFIAASFTAESRFPCSSNPDADEAFALGGLEVIHSGFEAARCEKVKTISDFCSENAIRLNLHVCWEDKSGENCGHCEKCCRSFLAGKANGCDTSLIGLPDIDFNTLKKSIRHALLAPDKVSIFADIKNTALRHYGTENLPKELKWFVSQNFERRAGKTLSLPYYSYTLIKQFLKRCFRKCKKMLVNALSIFAQND